MPFKRRATKSWAQKSVHCDRLPQCFWIGAGHSINSRRVRDESAPRLAFCIPRFGTKSYLSNSDPLRFCLTSDSSGVTQRRATETR